MCTYTKPACSRIRVRPRQGLRVANSVLSNIGNVVKPSSISGVSQSALSHMTSSHISLSSLQFCPSQLIPYNLDKTRIRLEPLEAHRLLGGITVLCSSFLHNMPANWLEIARMETTGLTWRKSIASLIRPCLPACRNAHSNMSRGSRIVALLYSGIIQEHRRGESRTTFNDNDRRCFLYWGVPCRKASIAPHISYLYVHVHVCHYVIFYQHSCFAKVT